MTTKMAKSRSFLKDVHNLYKNINSVSCGQASVHEYIEPSDGDSEDAQTKVIVEITPNDGFYKGGKWKFQIRPPTDSYTYPQFPPVVLCLTEIYHPNIDMSEDEDNDENSTNICVSLLEDGEWQASMTLEDCVQALLFLFYNPNWEDALSPMFTADMTEEEVRINVAESIKGGNIDGFEFEPNYGYTEENSNKNEEELVNEMNKLNVQKTDEMIEQQRDEFIQFSEVSVIQDQITLSETSVQNQTNENSPNQSNEPCASAETSANNDIREYINSILFTTIENAISQVDGVHVENSEESSPRSANSQTLKRSISLPASFTCNYTCFDTEQEMILSDIQKVKCLSKVDQTEFKSGTEFLFDNLMPCFEIMPLLTSILCDKVFSRR